MKRNKLNAPFI